jgi:hypothetical protein
MPAMNSDPHQSEPDHPDATAHPPLASATPHPPRRWWLKRIALAVVLFIAGFITLFVIWHRVADQRLQAAIDKIKAAGEPLFPEDFNTPPIPDEDNAAIVYARIAPLMERFEHSDGRAVLYRCRDLDANNQAFVSTCGTLLASQESAFELLREAQAKPDLRWFVEFKPPLLEIDFSELNLSAFRALSLLLHIRAQDEHRRGRDDLSVETVGQLLSLAEDIDRIPILLAHLVAGSILNRTVDLIQELIPNLNSLEIEQQVDRQPADRAAVESILNRLLDDAPARENIAQAFRYERATQLDSFYIVMGRSSARATNAANRSSGSTYGPYFVVGPVFKLDVESMLSHTSDLVSAIQLPNHRAYARFLRSCPAPPGMGAQNLLEGLVHMLSRILLPSLDRSIVLHYGTIARRRMAATALAIRLFELDHGHRPLTLDELVPDYLSEVPADPMSSNGVIQYLPNAEHPRLYSIGPDGIDDGGEYVYKSEGRINYDMADIPFFLNGQPPAPKDETDE